MIVGRRMWPIGVGAFHKSMESYDAVVCLGPNDKELLGSLLPNFRANLPGCRTIFVITMAANFLETCDTSGVEFIDEDIFPVSKKDIDAAFQVPSRSGWYLQQILKLYAPLVIPRILENYLIVDADVYFHRPVRWFEDGFVQFNVGHQYWTPYFEHMARFAPFLEKPIQASGICHMMPMKRSILMDFVERIEKIHGKPCWQAFLDAVDPEYYKHSGASEYELLFAFGILYHMDKCKVRILLWRNSKKITEGYDGDYEACHHYMRG